MKKQITLRVLLVVVTLLALAKSDLTTMNGKCATCILNSPLNYYCTKNNICTDTLDLTNSCEQGISTCLNYKSLDLGVFEIPPFNTTVQSFNQTLTDGQSVKFGISNQDSKSNAWFSIALYNVDSTTALKTQPSTLAMYYYDPNQGNMTSYVFSFYGKSYMKPLQSRFLYLAANGGDMFLNVTYGNKKSTIHT